MIIGDIQSAKVMPYAKAERIAKANKEDDPEWDYVVEGLARGKDNKHFPTAVIRVHDEDGRCLGWL